MSLYTFACMKVAQAGKAGTAHAEVETNLGGVLDFAKANRDRVKFWWPTSTDMALALGRKECALGNMHSTEMVRTLRNQPELRAIVPETDRAFTLLMWVVPKGTPRKELAEVAINLLLSEEVQREFARQGCATSLLSVAQEMAQQDAFWGQIYPSTEAQLTELRYYPYEAYSRDWDQIVEVWDKEVLRKG
jgi:spermidine/putrescine-binding protein